MLAKSAGGASSLLKGVGALAAAGETSARLFLLKLLLL